MRLTLGRSFEANALYLYAEDRPVLARIMTEADSRRPALQIVLAAG